MSARPHVVVVGDVVLDRDVHGRSDRLSPDAPVPVVDVSDVRERPGGAGLTALLCAASGARVTLVAPIADDPEGRRLRAALEPHVGVLALGHRGPTRLKERVRSGGQSLVRLDHGGPGTPRDVEVGTVRAALESADVVLVSDYGAGTTRDEDLRSLLAERAARGLLVWDPHPRGGAPVPRATLVTPNLGEARAAAAGDRAPAGDSPEALAVHLRAAWQARAVCVTAGAQGAYVAPTGGAPLFVPAPTAEGGDPCGAGDRFAATAAVALARGAVLTEAVQAAVAEATAWVRGGGADAFLAVTDAAHDAAAPVRPDAVEHRDVALADVAARLRAGGGTLVATGGCFDLVHAGHVAMLESARRMGDALVVLLNSDASVRRLKGDGRPVVTEADRARVLAAFDCVDAVVVFDEDDPRAALDALRPDVWAKGADYGGADLPEAEVVQRHGGRVVLLPYLDGRSTSTMIRRSGLARADHQ
ncbi:PfkB family carbohydrate kinase [Cellulomonas cellasea]|uniref:RfaE bifunctional protein nucleotidyltransferase chain/domain/rfaE bifunctional protein kinase chain/domain n=1 Tax=Cellulomonas cellasea TaxID=43670 RepID=A0A7W4YAP0_9CELL|nr:PfkB family carbohydrate kinase [Cellulomonas cellasea]MBB2921967.1 rfaE bifunctional protein nucleotidyltransferase chain/domain/rfaE bifunctional protein kinase chain/domain [Cellulomonas cellasea]